MNFDYQIIKKKKENEVGNANLNADLSTSQVGKF